jgi:hypothetical protein
MVERKTPVPRTGQDVAGKDDVSSFLAKVRSMPPVASTGGGRGRLIFAMDATMSRQPSWDRALQIQSDMFMATEKVGGLNVQLVYFRGFGECRASSWVAEPKALARLMTGVDCRGGNTQIGKVLSHVSREAGEYKINACVFVGDALEENIDALCEKAGQIGLLNVPVFMFQEGHDPLVEQGFKEIARLTGGAWFRLDNSSAKTLGELLSAVAVYAAGGRAALADLSRSQGGGARLLLEMLG